MVGVAVAMLSLGGRPALAHRDDDDDDDADAIEHGDEGDACNGWLAPPCGWFLHSGLMLGMTHHGSGRGADHATGAEVSVVHLAGSGWWYGGFASGSFDFADDNTRRVSVGPELGKMFLGGDLGYTYEPARKDPHGYTLRAIITFGLAALYVGGTHFPGAAEETTQFELGLLLKVPWNFRHHK